MSAHRAQPDPAGDASDLADSDAAGTGRRGRHRARPGGMVPIDPATLPALDAKVAEYVDVDPRRSTCTPPTFAAKAGDVRSMGDDDIRAAADTSNRLLAVAGARDAAGPAEPRRQGRRDAARPPPHDRGPRPEARPPASKKLLGLIPFGDKLARLLPQVRERADAPRRASSRRCTTARTSCARTTPRSSRRRCISGRRCSGSPSTSTSREHLDAALVAKIAADRGDRPREGEGAARRRAVLRPPEAPGPADAAGRLDPGLPGDRPRPQEQHRADQGRRPGDHDDDRRAAHRGDRRPGAGEPEARARPDHGAEHHDVEPDRVDVEAARDPERRHQQAGRVGDDRHRRAARPRSRTSTSRWTRSTRSRRRPSTR